MLESLLTLIEAGIYLAWSLGSRMLSYEYPAPILVSRQPLELDTQPKSCYHVPSNYENPGIYIFIVSAAVVWRLGHGSNQTGGDYN